MLKAYKYMIYPNKEQKIQIAKTFGCCRFVYNKTLVYRKDAYEKENRSVSKTDCNNYCNRELKKENEWLKEVNLFLNSMFKLKGGTYMALKDELKALIIKSGWTMTQVVEELNKKYNRNTSVQNFSSKLKRESLKYTEVEEVLNIIGYSITWLKTDHINHMST